MIEKLLEALERAINGIKTATRPTEISTVYPAGHPLVGKASGRFLRREGGNGQVSYEHVLEPRQPLHRFEVESETVVATAFDDLSSLSGWLKAHPADAVPEVYLHHTPFQAASIVALMDAARPELGAIRTSILRHPAFNRWATVCGRGETNDLTHDELCDLLLDNQEDLVDPVVLDAMLMFRGASTINFNSDQSGGGRAQAVTASWSGQGGPRADTKHLVPRLIEATFPAFKDAWSPGQEPKHKAQFRLRVVPPKGPTAQPVFRVLWVNANAYEQEAAEALQQRVKAATDPAQVYLGTPNVKHYLKP